MKVALIGRSTLYSSLGGDSIQMIETAKHMQQLGIEAEIVLANQSVDFNQFDLLHFFNVIRPEDILAFTSKSKLPYVISPIYVDYSHFEEQQHGIRGLIAKYAGKHIVEQLKNLARFLKGQEKVKSKQYWLLGQKKSMEKVVKASAMLLPNSQSELNRLKQDLHFNTPYSIVTNGIDPAKWKPGLNEINTKRNGVLCVARIEGLKNQHMVIEACRQLDIPLTLIGNVAPNHAAYLNKCKSANYDKLTLLPSMPQQELLRYYQSAKVHVLASWFETTGLASLEAGLMGCNLVISELGDAPDYFKDMVEYCHPASVESISNAIKAAYKRENSAELVHYISNNHTWQIAAEQTVAAYKNILA